MKLAVIRVRGQINVPGNVEKTLCMLKLRKRNHCIIVDDKPEIKGLLEKTRHLLTWGVVDDTTLELLKKRGKGPVYRLNPPRKGYGRKGVKMPFSLSGAFGDRKEKICDLIKRML
jgi:large subunit ribosomal protein L30